MANRKRHWVYVGPKPVKPRVPDSIKTLLKEQADEIITHILKPKYINKPPTDNDFNYLVEIYSKWYRNYFYNEKLIYRHQSKVSDAKHDTRHLLEGLAS